MATPTWGGIGIVNGDNDCIDDPEDEKKYLITETKIPLTPKRDIDKIQEWIHEMTVYCETLPSFVITNHSTFAFKQILNFELSSYNLIFS